MAACLRAVVLVVVLCGALWHGADRAGASDRVNGKCGMHIGLAVPVHPPLKPRRYHVRIGVKNGTSGGIFQCNGRHAGARAGQVLSWQPFSFPRWNWHQVLSIVKDSTYTAAGCASFAGAIAAEAPSFALSSALLGVGGLACANGIYDLGQRLPGTHDGPKAVRLVK